MTRTPVPPVVPSLVTPLGGRKSSHPYANSSLTKAEAEAVAEELGSKAVTTEVGAEEVAAAVHHAKSPTDSDSIIFDRFFFVRIAPAIAV